MPGGVVMATACGLFGKVQAKRDFISLNVPRRFLAVWEPWIQQGLARSKIELGGDWMRLFLTAPIWSFRFGAALCGADVVGVVMPSMDGAGRCFPLTIMACSDEGGTLAPSDDEAQRDWFDAAAQFLLSTLDPARSFEEIVGDLTRVPRPVEKPAVLDGSAPDATTRWWTEGGEDSESAFVEVTGLPASDMMTGMMGRRIEAYAHQAGSSS